MVLQEWLLVVLLLQVVKLFRLLQDRQALGLSVVALLRQQRTGLQVQQQHGQLLVWCSVVYLNKHGVKQHLVLVVLKETSS